MTPETGSPRGERGAWDARRAAISDVALIVLASVPLYMLYPAAGGVQNWQEATRALVAREMQRGGEWIVPTVFGEPYLNKPPLLYWLTVAIAGVRGGEVTLADARLAAGLAAAAGVVATYLVARPLWRRLGSGAASPRAFALWSAALLGTGVLYFRSARMAEIDILYTGPVVVGVACAWLVIGSGSEKGVRRSGVLLLLAAGAAALASLAKGPPPLAALLLGSAVAPVVVLSRGFEPGAATGRGKAVCAVVGAIVFLVAGLLAPEDDRSLLGLFLFGALGATLAAWLVDAFRPRALRVWRPFLWRTQPWLVGLAGAGALWLWLLLASSSVGVGEVNATVGGQASHNLELFAPNAASRNLGYLAYAVGVGSAFALAGFVWSIRERLRPAPLFALLLVWLVLGFAMFSLFGKGVARYMTPMWPGVAMLGALTILEFSHRLPRASRMIRGGAFAAVVVLGAGQALWYTAGRSVWQDPESADRLAARMNTLEVDPPSLVFINDDLRELEFVIDRRIRFFDIDDEPAAGDQLAALVDEGRPVVALTLDDDARRDLGAFADRFGVVFTPLDPAADPPRFVRLSRPERGSPAD